ncbi:MAG: pentapeptide repeat-containing protein [Chroococcidiopsidaceae cyanobacterium CP_BM_RX_35]|nr:pentapeptide repeat-containing protein [Chroococcidiopsidaceae cyanobacterium CP_BM_RX_35]
MEVLTSFIQERSPLQQDKQQNTNAKDTGKFATDVQAALTVIGRRDSRKDPEGNRIVLNFANLRKAHLLGADLREAHLLGADLSGADLLGADLSGAHLLGADLSGVHLLGAILRETDLSGADLSGADLREVKHLTQEQVKEAITDENTQLPDYLKVINSSQPDVPDQKQP